MLSSTNLGDLIRCDVDLDREAVFDLQSGGQTWSYRRLHETSASIGRNLLRLGCRRGDRIAIIAENSAEFLSCYLGAMRSGLVSVPINFKLPLETIAYILEDCSARVAVVDGGRERMVPKGKTVIRLDENDPKSLLAPVRGKDVLPRPGEIAEILYTSGSTGRPKGVPLSHDGQLWALSVHAQPKPLLQERVLIVAPMYHMNGLFGVSTALVNAVQVVLLPRFEARQWLRAIADYGCTMLSGIPTMFAMAAREHDLISTLDLSSVRRVSMGSAPSTLPLVKRVEAMFPNATVVNGYGTTEAGPSVFGEHPHGFPRPPLSVGYPVDGIEWRLCGGSDEGVLELRTPALMEGYLNLPETTAERMRDGWYATGDVMRRDRDGFFYFVGRADDMFVCGGENVYPGEVEKLIERHPDVMQAAVVPVPDDLKGHIPIAFVVPVPGKHVAAEILKAFCLREGPAYSHPRAFIMVDNLPVAGTHKIDKRVLVPRALEVARLLSRG